MPAKLARASGKKSKLKQPAENQPGMPAQTQTTAKEKSKKVNKQMREEIEHAVEQIPNLIMKSLPSLAATRPDRATGNEARPPAEPPHRPLYQYADHGCRSRRRWLWAGVIIFTAIVFGLWFWNTRSLLADTGRFKTKTEEARIWDNAKTDLRSILDTINAPAKNELGQTAEETNRSAIENLKAVLKESLRALGQGTASTSQK